MSSQPKPDRSGGLQRTQAPPNVENEVLHAERRQLTVAFIDIVGSTPLSERIDPEEFFAVIRTYRDICDEQIRHYDGHIARMIGDGLLAFFGVPQAHENDAERAVRASLAIAAAIKEHKFLLSDGSFVRLGVRIGVNTGVVVVGSVPGEPPDRREVFGSSAHVAARLQGLASENGVVVGSSTHELTWGTFSYAPLGRRSLKGVEEPVEAWRAEALASSESRFDRARRSPLAPMIDRTSESALLAEMWQQGLAGSGQVGVISGEPGIGKSRLIRQFRSSLDASPRDVLSLHVHRSTSTRRLPRKSSGSRARPASRRPTTRNSHWQNCVRFWQEPSPMSSRRFVTTERCCRYLHARDTSPRISDLPRSASVPFRCSSMFFSPPRASGRSSESSRTSSGWTRPPSNCWYA